MRNISIFSITILAGLLLSGCVTTPNPPETLLAKSDYYVKQSLLNPKKTFSDVDFKNSASVTGEYKDMGDFYVSSRRIPNFYFLGDYDVRSNAETLRLKFIESYDYLCGRMGGNIVLHEYFKTRRYCRTGDKPSEVQFYVEISELYSSAQYGSATPAKKHEIFEISVYARKFNEAPNFDDIVVSKLGYKSNEALKLEGYKSSYARITGYKDLKVKYEAYQSFLMYGDYDPDNVMSKVKSFLSENRLAYDAVIKNVADQKKRESEAKARELEEKQRIARNNRLQELSAIKKIGAVICQKGNGYRSVPTGYVISGIPQTRFEEYGYTVKGVVEAVVDNKVQIRISSIFSLPGGYMDSLKGEPTFTVNQLSWSDTQSWALCG